MSFNAILTRVMVYHPNPFLADAVCRELELCGPFTMKSCCADPERVVAEFRPNIVVLDPAHTLDGPGQLLDRMRQALPTCELLAYVDAGHGKVAGQCITAGFAGAVSQAKGIETLVDALTAVRMGGIYIDQCLWPQRPARLPALAVQDQLPDSLSDRERSVLEYVARGFSNKEAANRLGLSVKTVETYRSRASNKLGLRRKSDIVQFALRHDWLSQQPYTA